MEPQFAAGHPMSVYWPRLQSGVAKASKMKVPDQSYSKLSAGAPINSVRLRNHRRSEPDLRGTR